MRGSRTGGGLEARAHTPPRTPARASSFLTPAPCGVLITRCSSPLGAQLREVRPRVAAGARRGRGRLAQPLSRLRAGTRDGVYTPCPCPQCITNACTCTHAHAHAHMCLHMHAHTSTQVEYTLPRHHTQCIHARSSPNCPGAFCRFGTRQQTEALFAGCILPLWNAITKVTTTGRQKFLRVTRVRLSTGQRIVGVKVAIVAVVSLISSASRSPSAADAPATLRNPGCNPVRSGLHPCALRLQPRATGAFLRAP